MTHMVLLYLVVGWAWIVLIFLSLRNLSRRAEDKSHINNFIKPTPNPQDNDII